jgi:diguanylate cyclase (GGDEF)-like protein/PAS domain S-box-containing protein
VRSAEVPPDEADRLAALRALAVLDTDLDPVFDRLTHLAAVALDAPIALVTLIDEDRQWNKARVGIDLDHVHRDVAFCAHAIVDDAPGPFVVADTATDERFHDNPFVTGEPFVRFYAGQPVRSPSGHRVGTLCVMDRVPRTLSDRERTMLVELAALVEDQLAQPSLSGLIGDLEASAGQKAFIFDTMQEGLLLHDQQGRIVEWNPATESILGLSAEVLAGREVPGPLWSVRHLDGTPWPEGELPAHEVLRSGEPLRGVLLQITRPDGVTRWLRISSVPAHRPDGSRFSVTTFADVTAEQTAKYLLDATWLAAPVGLAVLDENGLLLQANEAFSAQVGVDLADVLGRPAVEFIHDDDAPVARSDYLEAHRTGLPTPSRDQRLVTSDGSARWISSTACPIHQGGRRLFVVATVDMTERRGLESDLRRFHHLFEHANDVITVVAGDGTPLYASPSSERLLGFPDGYQPEAGITGFVHPDDLEAASRELQALIAGTRGDDPYVVRVIDAHGNVKHLECMGVNLLDEPDVAGVVITSRDVSERQRLSDLLAHRATHDDLTGLANRTLFVERLTAALARSDRDGHRVAVCFLDLDDFKEINDRYGHAAGDELLVDVAGRLATHLRNGDEVARIGGDEFLVLFDPVDDEPHALEAAERLVEVVSGGRDLTAGSVWSGATAGVALGRAGEGAAALLARADGALYRAKAAGKARALLDNL